MGIHEYIQKNYIEIKNKIIAITKNHQNTDDLVNDCIISLLEKNNDFTNQLLQNNKVQHYLIRAAYIQYNSSTSPFHIKYRNSGNNTELEENIELEDKQEIHNDTERLGKEIKLYIGNLPVYERTLAERHFIDGNSLREMSRMYNINRQYITKDVGNIKKNIKISFSNKKYTTR